MPCKGICIRHKGVGPYANGHKRCQECSLFIKWDELYCTCCGYKLRSRPRAFSNTKLREQKRIAKTKSKNIIS